MQCFEKQRDKYKNEYERYFEACLKEKQKNSATTVSIPDDSEPSFRKHGTVIPL